MHNQNDEIEAIQQRIDEARNDLTSDLFLIEERVGIRVDEIKEGIQSIEQVLRSEHFPFVALGAAFVAGFAGGSLLWKRRNEGKLSSPLSPKLEEQTMENVAAARL